THEVEDPVRLLAEGDRIGLQRMDHVGELDRVADEEDGQVVADEIPVAVLGVELDGKAAGVACDFGGIAAADHRGEADRQRRLLAGLLEQLGAGVFRSRLIADFSGCLELAVADEAARMHHALGDALAVEMADLLEELIILERRRSARAHRALRLVVGDLMPLAVGKSAPAAFGFVLVVARHSILLGIDCVKARVGSLPLPENEVPVATFHLTAAIRPGLSPSSRQISATAVRMRLKITIKPIGLLRQSVDRKAVTLGIMLASAASVASAFRMGGDRKHLAASRMRRRLPAGTADTLSARVREFFAHEEDLSGPGLLAGALPFGRGAEDFLFQPTYVSTAPPLQPVSGPRAGRHWNVTPEPSR